MEKQEGRSLKSFSIQRRFGKSTQGRWRDDKIASLERAVKGSVSGHPYLVVVHSPFPEEPAQRETMWKGGEIPYALSGRGVGKTALLEAFVEVAKAVNGCEVLAFLDNREKLTDADNFFKDFFVEEILKRRRGLKDMPLFCTLESVFRRVGLFVRTSTLMFGTFLTWLLSALGLEIIKYFYDPGIQSGVNNLLRILSQYRGWLWIAGPLLLVGWWLYFIGELGANKELSATYSALGPNSLLETRKNNQKERLLANPANVLSFLSRRRCLVLVVDDVDYLDSRSFDSIIDLFQVVQKSNGKYRACLVLSFNPRNPSLWFPERAKIRESLSEESIRATESWLPMCITPLDLEQLAEVLCDYFGNSTPERLLEIIGREDPEALERTGQLLGFFVWLEAVLAKQQRSLKEVQEDELVIEFQRYVHRDQREVEEIIDAIRSQDSTEGALAFLKLLLAFQKRSVRVGLLAKFLTKEGYNNLALYERVLQNAPARLIRKESNCYEFREPYLKHILSTGWAEWKEQSAYYMTRAFDLLCDHKIWEPEQALKSAPSKAAIEILYSQGLFFYQYYGHSDAGYALRFLGLDKGGASGKWLSLCQTSLDAGENLWDLIFWRPVTFLNPYRGYKTSRSPWAPPVGRKVGEKGGWFFAPDLLVNTATAYWLMGYIQPALNLLTTIWEWIKAHLPSDYPDHWSDEQIAACRNHFKEADAEIRLTLAKILYHLGTGDSWTQAMQLCRPYARGELPANQQQLALARFIGGSIRHYRHFGVGKLLPPLQFRPDSRMLEEMLNVGADETADDLIRLRALYSASAAIWDTCLKKSISPHQMTDRGVPFDDVDRDQLDRLRQILEEALVLLKECRSRPKARPQDVPPGGRAAEAEIFFWEAVFLYQRYLLLSMDIGRTVTQYRLVLDGGKWHSRLNAYNSLAKLCVEFVNCHLFSTENRSSLSDAVFEFTDWIEDLLGKSASDVDFREVKRQLDNLYLKVLNGAVGQATDYFLAADAIYRRLGHQQGRAEILFQRGLMQYLLNKEADQTRWYELLMKSDYVTGALGFHLDRLCSQLIVAQCAETSNVFVAINGYQNSMLWCSDAGPGVPKVIAGEVAYRLGHEFLAVEQVRGAQENAPRMMEEARQRYEPYMDGAAFITPADVFERMLDIRWHIAELTKRKAARLALDDESRTSLLSRAEDNCNWIINRTKGEDRFLSREMSARVIKADIASLKGDFGTAFQELDAAIRYYEREKNKFWLLQTLVAMCEVLLSSKEAGEILKKSEIDYLNKLIQAALPYKERFEKDRDSLRIEEKSIFFHACWLLGQVWYSLSRPDMAIRWLFTAFDLLTSLGCFGNAILLDGIVREVLRSHNVIEDHKAYEDRLVQASQHINPREEANWQRIGEILRSYFPVQVAATEHLQNKRDCLRTYTAMVELGNVQEAIRALEMGVKLIEDNNPEDVDFELLEKLHDKYRETGNHERAVDTERKLQNLRDIDQSRNFLLLAERYRENGWDAKWALEIATDVSFKESRYYRRAKGLLDEIRVTAI